VLDGRNRSVRMPEDGEQMPQPIGTTARTGERCPESGVWKVTTQPSTTAPIAKNNVMPPYRNQAVTWQLVRHA
jgi:hypothetical protein